MLARSLVAGSVLLVAAMAAAATPPTIELEPGGRGFVYRLRQGDTPDSIARTFGLDAEALAALLVAEGATDWTRVRAGAAWRIPNPLAAPLDAERTRAATLQAERDAARARIAEQSAALERATVAATLDAAQRERLAQLERRWSVGVGVALALVAVLLAALVLAATARRREHRAVRWARALSAELEERRRTALLERQQTARRLVELEERIRQLEMPPATISGPARVRLVER